MPKTRSGSGLEDANTCQSSQDYRSKLRQLDCRQNKKPYMSNRANKPASSESKKLPSQIFKPAHYRKVKKLQRKRALEDVIKLLGKTKAKTVDGSAANSHEPGSQLCEVCNQKVRLLDCHRDKELETKLDNKIIQTDYDLSRSQRDHPSSKFNTAIIKKTAVNNTISTAQWREDSLDQDIPQDVSERFSPVYKPKRETEEIKREVWLKKNRAKLYICNSTSDKNKFLEEADGSKYIPTDKHRVTFKDSCIPILRSTAQTEQTEFREKGRADDDSQTNIIKNNSEFMQIECCNTLENTNLSKKTTVKEIKLLAKTNRNSITENVSLSKSFLNKQIKLAKSYPPFRKILEENTFENKPEIKNSLDEKKGCPRYFNNQNVLKDISNRDENNRDHIISFSIYEFPVKILKPIQNWQLPAEFTLHVDKYFYIRNCPVLKSLSYLHRFPHSSPTNVCTFLYPIPSKIRLPNFIFISTAPVPLAVLYNKKLYQLFENFMNIYSEFKVGNNFMFLNLFTDNEKPDSTPYPLQISTECEDIISSTLFNKLELKLNKVHPIVIMETESVEDLDFDNPCLFQKFGNFKFVSLNIMPDCISGKLKEFSSEKQVSVSLPFTVQRDSCSCMFVERKIAPACPIKAFLLTLTNNIRFIQSLACADSTLRPLKDIATRKLSPNQLKFKKKNIRFSRANRYKNKQLKKHGGKAIVEENTAFPIVKRKRNFQTTDKNVHKVKRLKKQEVISFDENIVPLTVTNEKIIPSTVANSQKTKYLESDASREFPQSRSPQTIPTMHVYKRKSCLSCESENGNFQISSSTPVSVCGPSKSSESKSFKKIFTRNDHLKSNSVAPMIADEPFPLSFVKKSNTSNTSLQVLSTHSATTAIRGNENVRHKLHSTFELKVEELSPETLTNSESSIPSDVLEFLLSFPPSSAIPSISNIFLNIISTANNIQTSTNTIKSSMKSEQIGKQLINVISVELNKSKSLSCPKITLSNSPTRPTLSNKAILQSRSASADRARPNLLGFMEVHFFEPIKGRNPNWRLSVCIPKSINTTALTANKIYPNAILSQSLDKKQKVLKTFLHVRKITNIQEIEGFIFEHAFDENASTSQKNGFDKQAFMFQPSQRKKMPPFTSSDFESLRRLNDSFLPNGMYVLTPVRKYGVYEIEIYRNLKNKHLNELKTEIGVCYNLGTECVEVDHLLNIPDDLFFASNAQLSDIF